MSTLDFPLAFMAIDPGADEHGVAVVVDGRQRILAARALAEKPHGESFHSLDHEPRAGAARGHRGAA